MRISQDLRPILRVPARPHRHNASSKVKLPNMFTCSCSSPLTASSRVNLPNIFTYSCSSPLTVSSRVNLLTIFYLFLFIPTDCVLEGGSAALVTSLFPTTHYIWKQGGRGNTKINLPQILFYIWLEKHRGGPENKSL